jgi:HTH-type transcriptional regulator/antitoxin HigA
MNKLTWQAAEHWRFVAPLLSKPTSEADYHALVEALDELLDVIGDDESHSLADFWGHTCA